MKKGSNLAVEALAGLASNEDFTSVNLKKSPGITQYLPYKDLMLIQVKGRRHVQARLVEPVASSINEGDNFILITPSCIYNYVGKFANIVEQSRAADIANFIAQKKDMGCKSSKVVITKNAIDVQDFWDILGGSGQSVGAGHPDEDELYESNMISTNMIYVVEGDELVPYKDYWGAIPKIEMLKESAVIVFDFGSEMYVWSGKTANLEEKKKALKLAQELWNEGFNYSECQICPVTVASVLGARKGEEAVLKQHSRPEWAIFGKITQHAETILFKEKFLDWPDESRVIRVRENLKKQKSSDASYDIQPCDAKEMIERKRTEPDLIIEGTHLGRGHQYFDEETRRLFEYSTLGITAWRILENTYEELEKPSLGHFYSSETYIFRWRFRMNVKGRDLSGKPSKHLQSGRDRTVYFFWQGKDASINEKGAAALLTVELDSESAPQIRVTQGSEPTIFLRLFEGCMCVHSGKRISDVSEDCRLFLVSGEMPEEIFLTEVPCSLRQLRSRASFIVKTSDGLKLLVWHGSQATMVTRRMARRVAKRLVAERPKEFGLKLGVEFDENEEGLESEDFKGVFGKKNQLYLSLVNSGESFDFTPRLFHFSSVSGEFKATEVECPYRSGNVTPYPFQQAVLYSAHQPGEYC